MYLIRFIIIASAIIANLAYADEFKLDKTVENIPKKALVIKHDAKLFESESSQNSEAAPFIQLYFMMTPAKDNRVPVLKTFSKQPTKPDGWLEKGTYIEWNTVQMINFETQTGRERVKIYATPECATEFGHSGKAASDCEMLGEEPAQNPQSRLFIPLFEHQSANYQGGFIRIAQDNEPEKSLFQGDTAKLGYDLVLVVDSTLSMDEYFQPTMRVLQSFIQVVQDTMQGEVAKPLNIGLLFYRDRNLLQKCDIGYLTQWAQALTPETEKVLQALDTAEPTLCDSEDIPEAVFDGIYRAIIDTSWNNSHFKTILLIGDAPPNFDKNPMNLNIPTIHELADDKSIRFLTFKIGPKDDDAFEEFEALALQRESRLKGSFSRIIKADIQQFETDLMDALLIEWEMFNKTLELSQSYGASSLESSGDSSGSKVSAMALNMTEYELPIIIGQLSKIEESSREGKDFIKGWVPRKIKNQLAFGEYIFMRKVDLKLRLLVIESILTAAEAGMVDGAQAFLSAVRETLAIHLKMKTADIFSGNEALGEILEKANILPFKTELLLFTPEEINTWKPIDYQKLNQTLTEKIRYLRQFSNNPNHIRLFEGIPYLYIPKGYFP